MKSQDTQVKEKLDLALKLIHEVADILDELGNSEVKESVPYHVYRTLREDAQDLRTKFKHRLLREHQEYQSYVNQVLKEE